MRSFFNGEDSSSALYERTGRKFALKITRPGLPSQRALDANRPSEGQIARLAAGPHVLKIEEHGIAESNQYYTLSEYSPAGTLDRHLNGKVKKLQTDGDRRPPPGS